MTITPDNYESILFRYTEDSLTQEDRHVVEAWLAAHPEALENLTLFSSTPTLELPPATMPHKDALRHKTALIAPFWRYAAAANVALLTGLLLWLHPTTPEESPAMVAESHLPKSIPLARKAIANPPDVLGAPRPRPEAKRILPQTAVISSDEERPAVAEVPTEQPLPKEETVVIIYEEILAPRIVDEPVLAWVAVDSTYSPTLADRLEDWSSQYTSQLNSQYLMARAEVLTRLSRRPFSRL